MLNDLYDLNSEKPDIFIDLEGENLSKVGQVFLLQLLLLPKVKTYLVDIIQLGDEAFNTRNERGTSFKDVLESAGICKAIFDVRNDSAALYHQYGISLANVHDIQLMENATRASRSIKHVNGLARCIERDATMSRSQRQP